MANDLSLSFQFHLTFDTQRSIGQDFQAFGLYGLATSFTKPILASIQGREGMLDGLPLSLQILHDGQVHHPFGGIRIYTALRHAQFLKIGPNAIHFLQYPLVFLL